ncbi:hypothetical protein LIER_01257 [Lithospermum erythrorhizon]|uniref:Uncharacterized protein n=1 Tax=Lithospermum erythrorhizon TaxID=34254 RepID=A0AAV3NMM4_LITER
MDLIGKVKPVWMLTQATWDLFIQHWTDPKTLRVSQSAKRSRSAEGAGRHGLGNISLKNRMRKQEEETEVRPSPFEILLAQNQKRNKLTGVDRGIHNAKFNSVWKYVLLFKGRYRQDMDSLKFTPDLYIWDALEEVDAGRKKGRHLGFGTRSQSVVFNPFPQSSFSSNDTTTLDLATQAVLAKEREDRKVEREALESKIAALEKAQVDSSNEFWEIFANLQNELTQSHLSGSNLATKPILEKSPSSPQ